MAKNSLSCPPSSLTQRVQNLDIQCTKYIFKIFVSMIMINHNNTILGNMVINFSAGPAKIPVDVLKQVQSELLDFAGTGMSITELSHRSPEFTLLLKDTSALLREIMDVPDNYQILWLAGGASGLFSSIPLNLISSKDDVVDHIVTGNWSKGAAKEAEKYTNVNYVVPVPANFSGKYSRLEIYRNFTQILCSLYYVDKRFCFFLFSKTY